MKRKWRSLLLVILAVAVVIGIATNLRFESVEQVEQARQTQQSAEDTTEKPIKSTPKEQTDQKDTKTERTQKEQKKKNKKKKDQKKEQKKHKKHKKKEEADGQQEKTEVASAKSSEIQTEERKDEEQAQIDSTGEGNNEDTGTDDDHGKNVTAKDPVKDPVKDPAQDPSKDPVSDPSKEPDKKPEDTPSEGSEIPEGYITCTIEIRCDSLSSDMSKLTDESVRAYVPADGVILNNTTVTIPEGESVYYALRTACRQNQIAFDAEYTAIYDSSYVKGIQYLYEEDAGENSGWMYKVNDIVPNYGCSKYIVQQGDRIQWEYTCDLGKDI